MLIKKIVNHILQELKNHIPFTLGGAVLGVVFMLAFSGVSLPVKQAFFMVAHPGHVLLSALVTASMFKLHSKFKSFLFLLIIGWTGSIGVATLSDIIIPHFFGTQLLGLNIPVHQAMHQHTDEQEHSLHTNDTQPIEHTCSEHSHDSSHIHFAFIEHWYIVNPAAILGILIAWKFPNTKISHAGHILLSTWASCSYVLMTSAVPIDFALSMALVLVLFISVWFPCCFSDIIFPLFFTGVDTKCPHCLNISHRHH